ncbi:hypothetical protein SFC08_01615 [Lysinibacillus halotolerans]|uniref:Uncharacterized protein n=1 Tax=Lysinibacillus halotolerans TaxID=1368476 RepID=A0A3M8HCC4_9BACI|nr:hypothetical protein [Lysinibacillus halotolerans]RND00033.1 hypothetical protein EC501_05855 [Lysinibacillus halotolerans]
MKVIDVAKKLEKMIAVYFNGNNYVMNGLELSREDSKIIAFSLIHAYQLTEWIIHNKTGK